VLTSVAAESVLSSDDISQGGVTLHCCAVGEAVAAIVAANEAGLLGDFFATLECSLWMQ
jgi:hypothetical protein